MSILKVLNDVSDSVGGKTDSKTIVSALNEIADALAGSDLEDEKTIEEAIKKLGQYIGGGSSDPIPVAIQWRISGGEATDDQMAIVLVNGEPVQLEQKDDAGSYYGTYHEIICHAGDIITTAVDPALGYVVNAAFVEYNQSKEAWIEDWEEVGNIDDSTEGDILCVAVGAGHVYIGIEVKYVAPVGPVNPQ